MKELARRVYECRMQLPVGNSKFKRPRLWSDIISGNDFIGLGRLSTTCMLEHLEGIEEFCPKYKFRCRVNVAVRKVRCFINITLILAFYLYYKSLCL